MPAARMLSGPVRLVGVLAAPPVLAALGLEGAVVSLPGILAGGGKAGVDRGGWPRLVAGQGTVTARRVIPNAALNRYARVMGLAPVPHDPDPLLGLGGGGPDGDASPELAAEIARQILDAPVDLPPERLAGRLPMIAAWAASVLRGRETPAAGGGLLAPRGPDAVRTETTAQPFSGYFAVQVSHLRHRTHAGAMSPVLRRETFISGDAVVVLPWDPHRDRVLLVEQFRMAPFLRGDPQPWLLETVAGRVDAGETVEEAARREAQEEAGLALTRLVPAISGYPSPGAFGEYLYLFVGIAELPDGVAGIHGLECEAEDIRTHVIDRAALSRLALEGQIANGPLATLALWLELRAAALRDELRRP